MVQTFKAKLVAKCFTQRKEVDYKETLSPTTMLTLIRIFLSIATYYDYEILQMDVKTTYFNGNIDESIYMSQLERLQNKVKNIRFASFRDLSMD